MKDEDRPTSGPLALRPQNRHLRPTRSLDEPSSANFVAARDEYNRRRKETKKRHETYKSNIAAFKSKQLQRAQDEIEAGTMPDPAQLLITMIKEQQLRLAGEKLTKGENLKERQMLLLLYKEYAALTGANAPGSQTIDVAVEPEEPKSSSDIQDELIQLTTNLRLES